MKPTGILAIILLVISLFLGIVVVSIAIGAVAPVVHQVSAPFICSGGKLEVGQIVSNPLPGETTVEVEISCVNEQTGEAEAKTATVIIVSGLIYSLIIFAVSFIWFIRHPDSWGLVKNE